MVLLSGCKEKPPEPQCPSEFPFYDNGQCVDDDGKTANMVLREERLAREAEKAEVKAAAKVEVAAKPDHPAVTTVKNWLGALYSGQSGSKYWLYPFYSELKSNKLYNVRSMRIVSHSIDPNTANSTVLVRVQSSTKRGVHIDRILYVFLTDKHLIELWSDGDD